MWTDEGPEENRRARVARSATSAGRGEHGPRSLLSYVREKEEREKGTGKKRNGTEESPRKSQKTTREYGAPISLRGGSSAPKHCCRRGALHRRTKVKGVVHAANVPKCSGAAPSRNGRVIHCKAFLKNMPDLWTRCPVIV